jgi:hypothetical protein
MRHLRTILLALIWAFAPHLAYAQVTSGAITGAVTDPTGGVIGGASLTLTNSRTGDIRTELSDVTGVYRFAYLPVGQYKLRAEMRGFAALERSPLDVLVDTAARVDLTLMPGEAKQTIEVTGAPPPLNTESANIGGVIEHAAIVNLPLNGRNFLNLVALQPGGISTAKVPGGGPSFITTIHGGNFSLFGAPAEDTEYLLDGVTVRDNGGTNVMVRPIVDAIEEFNFQASNYSAAFGNVDGGVINMTTRGGGNKFHGGVWEFLRNEVFDARNFFDGASKPPFHQNQFGGDLGGPIKTNKLFFFVAYEALRSAKEIAQAATVPTIAERSGNFAGLPPIFNPGAIDGATSLRQPFAGNQVPRSLWSAQALAALDRLYPLPNLPGISNNLVEPADRVINSDQIDSRGDWNVSDKDRVFARYTWFRTNRLLPWQYSQLPNFKSIWNSPVHNAVLSESHVFSSRTVNELKIGLNRPAQVLEDIDQKVAVNQQLGITGTSPTYLGNPTLKIAGLSNTGAISNAPNDRTQYDYSIVDNFSHTTGSHTLQWGGSNVWHIINGGYNASAHGSFTFDGSFTGQLGAAANTILAGTGNPAADFLLGFPAVSQRCCLATNGFRNWRRYNLGFYFQDDWKVTRKLTVNLGLRYDYHSASIEANNRFAEPDLSAAPNFTLLIAEQNGVSKGIRSPNRDEFAPRLGFAYSPNSRLVIRGGYALNFNDINQDYTFRVGGNLPFASAQIFTSSKTVPQLTLANAFPAALAGASAAYSAINPKVSDPYVQHWNLTLEHAVGSGIVLSASYIGNKGSRLDTFEDANAPDAGPGAIGPRRPIPSIAGVNYLSDRGKSIYNGLELKAEKRFSRGLSFLAGYVWSKCIDSGGTALIGDGSPELETNPRQNDAFNRGRCQYDVPQRLNGNVIWEPQYGKSLTGLPRAVAGGWQFQGILDIQAGQPFSVFLPYDNSNTGRLADRADLAPGQDPNKGPRTSLQWFNTSAFVTPAPFTYGNAGRNIVTGPGVANLDLSLFKNFPLGEGQVISFRVEAFNAVNHTNFYQPGNKFGTPTFGTIGSSFDSREIQFGLKFNF